MASATSSLSSIHDQTIYVYMRARTQYTHAARLQHGKVHNKHPSTSLISPRKYKSEKALKHWKINGDLGDRSIDGTYCLFNVQPYGCRIVRFPRARHRALSWLDIFEHVSGIDRRLHRLIAKFKKIHARVCVCVCSIYCKHRFIFKKRSE